MPDQSIPPIPTSPKSSGSPKSNTQKDSSAKKVKVVEENDGPIRLKPEAEAMPVSSPSSQESHRKNTTRITQPSSDEAWETNLTHPSKKSSRHLIPLPLAICLTLCLFGALIWSLTRKENIENRTQPTAILPTSSPLLELRQEWKVEARNVLRGYLHATAEDELDGRMRYVTPTLETKTLLPRFRAPKASSDVVDVSSFVAKPLPKSFLEHGIYLMYYQRPNTLSDNALFRPIVPMRVKLKLDSPSFLEVSAYSGSLRESSQQNICAFFKRGNDGSLSLDWPLFNQTRHRQLSRFVEQHDLKARHVFRLMVLELEPALKKNIYNQQKPGNDWYRIHCPGYDQETHVVSVPNPSPAADFLKRVFSSSPYNHQKIHAITAELAWLPKGDRQQHTLGISKIICLEFLGLNAGLKTR